MWWALAAQYGMQFLEGLIGREQQKAQNRLTEIENEVQEANAENANRVRDANNELAAAKGSLQRYRKSLGDQHYLRDIGNQQEQIQTNLIRSIDDLERGSLESRLDTAFELGAVAARTAAAGVSGGSKQAINATIRMTEARKQAALENQQGQMTYDAIKYLTNTQADAYNLDGSVFLDSIDRNTNTFMPQYVQKVPNAWSAFFNAGANTVSSNPELVQTTLDDYRSTDPKAYSGNDWTSSVSMKV